MKCKTTSSDRQKLPKKLAINSLRFLSSAVLPAASCWHECLCQELSEFYLPLVYFPFFPVKNVFYFSLGGSPSYLSLLAQVTTLLCPVSSCSCPEVQIFCVWKHIVSCEVWFPLSSCPMTFLSQSPLNAHSTWVPSYFLSPLVFLPWISDSRLTSGCRSSAFPFLVCCSLPACIGCWHPLPHAFAAGWIHCFSCSPLQLWGGWGGECFGSNVKEILKNASDNNCKEVSQKVVKNRQSCSKHAVVHRAFLWHQYGLKQLAPFHGSLCFAGIAVFVAMVSHSGEQILLERSVFF